MSAPVPQEWQGIELCDIPSGMGGVLPAAFVNSDTTSDGKRFVVCLHPEFFTNWVLTVPADQTRPCSYRLDAKMKRIIKSRKSK